MNHESQRASVETAIRAALAAGHCFQAHDLCREALATRPDNLHLRLLAALVSLHAGDVTDARAIVGPLAEEFESTESRVQRLATLLAEPMQAGSAGAQEVASLLGRLSTPVLSVDAVALDLMAEICREAWRRVRFPGDLTRAANMASRAFSMEPTPDRAYAAAVLARLCDKHDEALTLARYAMEHKADETANHAFARHARSGLFALLQDDRDAAIAAFDAAGQVGRNRFSWRVALRRELTEMAAAGLDVPPAAFVALPLPAVVLFSGPGIDPAGAAQRCFPPQIEGLVARKIAEQLELLGAEIGYACADPGANLMFIEAMLERDAEINIVLPCAVDDFIEQRVRPAGGRWEKRFRSALKLATSVTLTTTDPLLNDRTALEHNSRIIDGTARLRARSLGCHPCLLTVWDFSLPATPGSTASFIDQWGDPTRLRMIDLDDCRVEAGVTASASECLPATAAPAAGSSGIRTVCAMLFADIVGYSKLGEADLPAFWRYMTALEKRMGTGAVAPVLVESWGDALYVVHQTSRGMARYATDLANAFACLDSRDFGLPCDLSVRIGLHTGPVFLGKHPLTGRDIVYGGQVNRAARIEPIGKPGMIYASEQFVASLVAEESLYADETGTEQAFAFEYIGTLELAKNYGPQAIYLLTTSPASPAT